jgi:hypothetical protein
MGPGEGGEVRVGAVHLDRPVWAPYHACPSDDFHISQHTLSDARAARVTAPDSPAPTSAPPAPETATLIVVALEDGPATNDTEAPDADNVEGVSEP